MPMPDLPLAKMASSAGIVRDVLELPHAEFEVRAGQVDLVDDRDDLEALGKRQVRIGHRLRLDALRGVDQEHARPRRPRQS